MSAAVPRLELAPGYSISRVIHGGWQLSQGHRTSAADPAAVLEQLARLADAGFTTFDCADIYTGVEELLGRFLAERRAAVGEGTIQVHTKLVPDLAALPTLSQGDVEAIVDRSLRRLGVERLDLVQFHWWDYAVPGYVEAMGWLADLQRAGKIRLLGVTNFDGPRLAEILDAGIDLATHQVQYSLLDRRPRHGMAELCERHGVRLLCYGSLAGGFLTDRYRAAREPRAPLANRSLVKYQLIVDDFGGWPAFQQLHDAVAEVARRHGVSSAAVASRWVLDRPQVGGVIVGLGRDDYLAETLKLCELRLDAGDHQRLDAILARFPGPVGDTYTAERVVGGRHAAVMRTDLNRSG